MIQIFLEKGHQSYGLYSQNVFFAKSCCAIGFVPTFVRLMKQSLFKYKYLAIIVLWLILPVHLYSQTDNVFWFVAPEVSKNGGSNFDIPVYLRLSNYSSPVTVVVSMPANPSFVPINVSIPANGAQTIDLSAFVEVIENKPADAILNKGLLIESSGPITAYYEVASTYCMCNPEIFALKGKNALGTQFLLPGQTHFNNSGGYNPVPYNTFDVVATVNNTVVTITPKKAILGHAAGVTFSFTLNKGETWCGKATSQLASEHLHGTEISSNYPIAVTLTDDLLHGISGCADLAGDQAIPVSLAGNEYIAVKGFLTNGGERAFILGLNNNTDVWLDGSASPVAINKQQVYNHVITDNSTYINSNKPVLVYQTTGFGCELGSAVLPPIACTGSSSVTFTRTTNQQLGLIIFTRQGNEGGFLLNGSATFIKPTDFQSVTGTMGQWMAARITFTTTQIPMGTTCLVTNSLGLFHMGVIIGDYGGGCSYGFFSGFASLSLGPDVSICNGDSILLDAGPGMNSYIWNNGSSSSSIYAQDTGWYWVQASNGMCLLSDSVYVSHYPENPIDLGNDTLFCAGSSLLIDAGTGYQTYLWQPGNVLGQSLTITAPGIYYITVSDDNECVYMDEITVTEVPLPVQVPIKHN